MHTPRQKVIHNPIPTLLADKDVGMGKCERVSAGTVSIPTFLADKDVGMGL